MITRSERCSSLPLADLCAASLEPPKIQSAGGGEPADVGHAVHKFMAERLRGNNPLVEDLAAEFDVDSDEVGRLAHWSWRAWLDIESWFPNPMVETPLRWDAEPVSLTGTLDVLSMVSDVEARICDHKSGRLDQEHSAQLRGYALLVVKNYPSVERVYAVVLRLRDQVLEPASDGREPGYYYRDELEQWWERLSRKIMIGAYNHGAHCRFCKRANECPMIEHALVQAHNILKQALVSGTVEEVAASLPADPAELGRVGMMIKDALSLVESRGEVWKKALKARIIAAGGRVPSGDGRELVVDQQVHKHVGYRLGLPVLERIFRPDQVAECMTVSKVAVEKAAKEGVPKRQKGAAIRRVMAALDEAGAITEHVIERLEVKRKQQRLECNDGKATDGP